MAEVLNALNIVIKALRVCFWFRVASGVFSATGMLCFIPVTMQQAKDSHSLASLMWTTFATNITQELIFAIALIAMIHNLHHEIEIWNTHHQNAPLRYPEQPLKPLMLVSLSDVVFDVSNILSAWLWVESAGFPSSGARPPEAYISFGFGWAATACDMVVLVMLIIMRIGYRNAFETQTVTVQMAAAVRDQEAAGYQFDG